MQINIPAILIGIFGVMVVWMYFRKAEKVKTAHFLGRKEYTLHEIYKSFFSDSDVSEKCFEELWQELADLLELPASKLLPSDRFSVELAPPKGLDFGDPAKDVISYINKKCHEAGISPSTINTIEDYILTFGKESQK